MDSVSGAHLGLAFSHLGLIREVIWFRFGRVLQKGGARWLGGGGVGAGGGILLRVVEALGC